MRSQRVRKPQSPLLPLFTSLIAFCATVSSVNAAPEAETRDKFDTIPQPLPVKIAVTAGGLALIGLELWWFLGSKTEAQQAAESDEGIQEIDITVDGGYQPDRIVVEAGKPVRLNFFRKDPSSCVEQVILPDFNRSQELKLDDTTPVEFTPKKPGQYEFHCGMNMVRGELVVRDRKS